MAGSGMKACTGRSCKALIPVNSIPVRCKDCRSQHREYDHNKKKRKKEKVSNSEIPLCTECTAILTDNYATCEACREKSRLKSANSRSRKKAKLIEVNEGNVSKTTHPNMLGSRPEESSSTQPNMILFNEEVGDAVRPHCVHTAIAIYRSANIPGKVVSCYAETGQIEKILPYAKDAGHNLDFCELLPQVQTSFPDKAATFAIQLMNDDDYPQINIDKIIDVYLSRNMVMAAISFLLDVLDHDEPEQAHLQTLLLELNLTHSPQAADTILKKHALTHYDRPRIAYMCEKAGLWQRALEHYEDMADIRRVIMHATAKSPEWLVDHSSRLSTEQLMACMHEMLRVDSAQNLQVVIQIATKHSNILDLVKLIEMFESFKSFEGLYYYLASVVNLSEDPEVHFKYIQAAARTGQIREVERICRESNFFDPEKVKNFLQEAKLSDQLPLIIVCDRFDFVHDLVLYLYQNALVEFIEVYVQRVNSVRTPQVVGGLLDVGCNETTINELLASITGKFSTEDLVHEVEQRNRLDLILPWLDARVQSGSQDPPLYNAMAKILINSKNNPEGFLKENNLYEPLVVGKFCENCDPYFAYIAYAKGFCDDELIAITNDNTMFKQQARYLVKRRELDLWAQVLVPDNIHRPQLIYQVSATALPECTDLDDVSATVKAFLQADLPIELIELLEKIIIEPSPFSDNRSLQTMLMLTAIRVDKGKVASYIDKLRNYDSSEIARIAIEQGLYEEALSIYKKYDDHLMAINVLVKCIVSLDRGADYANMTNHPDVWSCLAKAQLDALLHKESIDSYINAQDPSNFLEVIDVSNRVGNWADIIRYLEMASKTLDDPRINIALANAREKANAPKDDISGLLEETEGQIVYSPDPAVDDAEEPAAEDSTHSDHFEPHDTSESHGVLVDDGWRYRAMSYRRRPLGSYRIAVEDQIGDGVSNDLVNGNVTASESNNQLSVVEGEVTLLPSEGEMLVEPHEKLRSSIHHALTISEKRRKKRRGIALPSDVPQSKEIHTEMVVGKGVYEAPQGKPLAPFKLKKCRQISHELACKKGYIIHCDRDSIGSLYLERQLANCTAPPYSSVDFLKQCRGCISRRNEDMCRFKNARYIYRNMAGLAVGVAFADFSDTSMRPTAKLPLTFNEEAKLKRIEKMKTSIANYLLPVMQEALDDLAVHEKSIVYRDQETGCRATCDSCMTSIFLVNWMCKNCGLECCRECFQALETANTEKMYTPPPCSENEEHIASHFLAVTRLKRDALHEVVHDMQAVVKNIPLQTRPEVSHVNIASIAACSSSQHVSLLRPGSKCSSSSLSSAPDISEVDDLPSLDLPIFHVNELTEDIFVDLWEKGRPLVVKGVGERLRVSWTPEYFKQNYGDRNCRIVECQTRDEKKSTVGKFFDLFLEARKEGESWKLKDWPPTTDFKNEFPELFEDFSNAIPMPSYVRRDGLLNVASHFALNAVAPDLGPKMYNAQGNFTTAGSKGSTRLHMDMADAVNVMPFAADNDDGSPGGAAWDLFRPEDSEKIREYLSKKFSEEDFDDPIHEQRFFLDDELRSDLYRKTGVQSYHHIQRPGEAVFIPAGSAHQVCNFTSCIKVAIDYVSPENIHRCEQLTKEFRKVNQLMAWKEDVLQLRTMTC